MSFTTEFGIIALLVSLTLVVQCAAMAGLIVWGRSHVARGMSRLGAVRSALLVARFTGVIMLLHVLEILLWSGFYRWACFPSWEAAFYFSATSYSTVGYGDLLLPRAWRTVGPVESITGVLMCGLSASFLFAIVTLLVKHEEEFLVRHDGPSVRNPRSSVSVR